MTLASSIRDECHLLTTLKSSFTIVICFSTIGFFFFTEFTEQADKKSSSYSNEVDTFKSNHN